MIYKQKDNTTSISNNTHSSANDFLSFFSCRVLAANSRANSLDHALDKKTQDFSGIAHKSSMALGDFQQLVLYLLKSEGIRDIW